MADTLGCALDIDGDEHTKRKLIETARNGCAVSNTLARGAEMDIQLDA